MKHNGLLEKVELEILFFGTTLLLDLVELSYVVFCNTEPCHSAICVFQEVLSQTY